MPLSDAWIDAAAGWCSGAAAVLAVQPVDTILTRRQAGLKLVTISGSSGSMAASLGPTPTFAITNLWRGAWPMIAAVPFQNALLMGGYGLGLAYTTTGIGNGESHGLDPSHKDQPVEPSYAAIFVGGTTGGILQSFLMSPVELVKVRQQCQGVTVTAAVRSGATTLAHRGLTATLMRDGIPHGVWFCSYQYAKDYMTTFSHANNSDNVNDSSYDSYTTWTVPLASGAVAAVVAWGVGYPADLIKTKIQYAPQPASFVETGRQIVRERGWPGLYHGFGLKLVRAVPASMIGFCVYEAVKKQISSF